METDGRESAVPIIAMCRDVLRSGCSLEFVIFIAIVAVITSGVVARVTLCDVVVIF